MAILMPPPPAEHRPIGELLDTMGVLAELGPADSVDGALVLLRVTAPGRPARAVIARSPGLGRLDRLGLLEAAER